MRLLIDSALISIRSHAIAGSASHFADSVEMTNLEHSPSGFSSFSEVWRGRLGQKMARREMFGEAPAQ